jgi:hypothetical protein
MRVPIPAAGRITNTDMGRGVYKTWKPKGGNLHVTLASASV